jgi:hypothetical protein
MSKIEFSASSAALILPLAVVALPYALGRRMLYSPAPACSGLIPNPMFSTTGLLRDRRQPFSVCRA